MFRRGRLPAPDQECSIARSEAHPAAAAAFDRDWYWDTADELSPFGNAQGSDTLGLFREWRRTRPEARPVRFMRALLKGWRIKDEGWEELECAAVRRRIESDRFGMETRDRVAVALALGQIALEGRLDADVRRLAVAAAKRQALGCVAETMATGDADLRRERFGHIVRVLEREWAE